MDDTKPISLEQMRAFVAAGGAVEFHAEDLAEYACVGRTLRQLVGQNVIRIQRRPASQSRFRRAPLDLHHGGGR